MGTQDESDREWPPGTAKLEDVQGGNGDGVIILHPQPSADPNDPLNWSKARKHINFALVSFYAFMIFVVIDVTTPTWSLMNEELGFSYDLLNDSYAAASGALTLGAVLLIPFALKYGRRPIYVISSALQFAICIWSARMQTVADLMLTNILNCGLGALSEVVVQMTVADMIYVHQRGVYNSIYVFMCNFGGNMAPVAAGYVAAAEGWRWVWWWTAIFMGATFLAFSFFYEETKFSAPAVQVHDDLGLAQTGNDEESKKSMPEAVKEVPGDGAITTESTSAYIDFTIPKKTTLERLALWSSTPGSLLDFSRHMWQPFPILFTFPGVFYMSLLSGILTAASAIIITTLSDYMTLPPYNFNSSQIGLMSIAPYIGNTIGSLICGPVSDWIIVLLAKRNKGVYEPEMRLWVLVAFIPLIPAGIFMFGMGLYFQAPWPLLAFGYGVYAVGTAPMSSIALTYVVDSYTEVVGDALVGMTFFKNLISTVFIYATPAWIDASGMKNCFITIGIIFTVVLIGTVGFLWWGKKFRIMTAKKYRYYASRQYNPRSI